MHHCRAERKSVAAIVARLQWRAMCCSPLKSMVLIWLYLFHKIMREICQVFGWSIAGLFWFCFVVCTDSFIGSTCMGISFGLGGQAWLSHMLGFGLLSKILFQWFVLFSLGASWCYYYLGGVVDSHLLLRWSGSKCCNTASTWVKPSVTDFAQVWVLRGSTSLLHLHAALQSATSY